MMRPGRGPLTVVELERTIGAHQGQIAGFVQRLPDLDEAITATRVLLGAAEERLRAQEGEVCRAQLATGRAHTFGRPADRTVRWTSGRGTVQLAGPAAADSAQGRAEQARRVFDALEAEAQPIRAALVSLERERADTTKAIGLLTGEVDSLARQLGQLHSAEAERSRLVGKLDWQSRLAGILRRVAGAA